MPLWIGDLLAKVVDLDAREFGAYMFLIMALWTRGGTLPNDQKKLQRVARCGREWPKVWQAIAHYFDEADGMISQSRVTEELQKCAVKREVNAHNGARGGMAKSLKSNDAALANASNSLQRNPTISEPEPYIEEIGKPISRQTVENLDGCLMHFNSIAAQVGWSQVQKMTAPRRASLLARIKDCGGQDAWCEAMTRAGKSPLLTGQNNRGWRSDFDWLAKPANFTKLMEGNYDPRPDNAGAGNHGRPRGSHDSMVAAFAYVANRQPD